MDAIAAYGSDDDAAIGVDASSREVQARSGDRHLEHGERSTDGGSSVEAPETSAGGRVRSFPHVEGDFATHVRVPVEIPLGVRASLARALAEIVARAPALRPVGRDLPVSASAATQDPEALLPEPRQTHVSVSRVFATRAKDHAGLHAALRRRLAATRPWTASVGPGFKTFVNDERTSVFVALAVSSLPGGGDGWRERGSSGESPAQNGSFAETVRAVDAALASRGHARFYDDPDPHVSVLWAPLEAAAAARLGVVEAAARDVSRGTEGPASRGADAGTGFRFETRVDKVVCRVSGFPETTVWGRPGALPPPAAPDAAARMRKPPSPPNEGSR